MRPSHFQRQGFLSLRDSLFGMMDAAFLVQIPRQAVLATCNINSWALDFDGNLSRIRESIIESKSKGAKYRLGPELEICGYSCEDHFLENDTYLHCDQSLASIIDSDLTDNILCDIGCPIIHQNVRYNCRVFILNRKIVLIRPKMFLADDGNYRERRWFTAWKCDNTYENNLVQHTLSDILRSVTGQNTVPFGVAAIETSETLIASEICEELWAPDSPHVNLYLAGVEIISNGSASHHQLGKLQNRLNLIQNASSKCGGVYMYANQQGCDGNRLYFDGASLIYINGSLVAQASQFSLQDVEVKIAVVDLDDVRSYRGKSCSVQEQSSSRLRLPILRLVDMTDIYPTERFPETFSLNSKSNILGISRPLESMLIHSLPEECAYGPACWMWDYLRRSNASGFLLPLSGGADSAAVAGIVKVMCDFAVEAFEGGNIQVISDVSKLLKITEDMNSFEKLSKKQKAETLCNSILHTIYIATNNSSHATKSRADRLAGTIGAYHTCFNIDMIISSVLQVFKTFSGGKVPKFLSEGGSNTEDLSLQNIQARLRMVMAYLCAQLFPWLRGRAGFLLVLGSANVDEALRGYMTKYDCSSADINPIGGICKNDLKNMLKWIAKVNHAPVLEEIADARPSAELRPIENSQSEGEYTQTDEEDMGMSYAELGRYGYFRKVKQCGPVSMFLKLIDEWGNKYTVTDIGAKVKKFFYFYSINRHKMTTLTPSYHAENYSPDDNRFDLRPFLYNSSWDRQFATIDTIASHLESTKKC